MQIKEGKFYRSASGVKVGPMQKSVLDGENAWSGPGLYIMRKEGFRSNVAFQVYKDDGSVSYMGPGEEQDHLVAEWTDEPAAAQNRESTGPIRETVVKKLVTGLYDTIVIEAEVTRFDGSRAIQLRFAQYADRPRMTSADLRSTAKLFNQLADYLDDPDGDM